MNPTPLPTPFDIAEIPVFNKPFDPILPGIICLIILVLICAFLYYRKRRLITQQFPTLVAAVKKELTSATLREQLPRSTFALLWKKVSRIAARSQNPDRIQPLLSRAEALLYGPSYSSHDAQKLLTECLVHLQGEPWQQ